MPPRALFKQICARHEIPARLAIVEIQIILFISFPRRHEENYLGPRLSDTIIIITIIIMV
jgi:hypothetical protein